MEYIKIGDIIYDCDFKIVRRLNYAKHEKDQDLLIPLIYEVVSNGNSVLVFCATKDQCEKCAVRRYRLTGCLASNGGAFSIAFRNC